MMRPRVAKAFNGLTEKPMITSRGFTMIELMVVVAVVALLLAIGVPSFRSTIANHRATAATNEVLTSLRVARSEAIKTARYVTVCKSADGATCGDGAVQWEDGWIVFVNTGAGAPGDVDAGDQIIRIYPQLPGDLTLRPIGVLDDFLSYRPTGSAGTSVQNLSGTLTLCDPKGIANKRALIVMASGSTNVSYDAAHDGSALECP